MILIKYVPLVATNATGLGERRFYNADGALGIVAVTSVFEAAKSTFMIGSDAVYSAMLVESSGPNAVDTGGYRLIDFFQRDASAIQPYILAYQMQQAPIDYGPIT